MLKTVITPNGSTYPLPIPPYYAGKRLEVLLYSGEELLESNAQSGKKPSEYFGTLSAAESEEFHRYVANSRLEWDRNI